MLNIPSEIDFGFKKFKVMFEPNYHYGGDWCYGASNFHKGVIYINSSIDDNSIKDTLLHEIFHVILIMSGYDNVDESLHRKIMKAEDLVIALTTGLMLVFNLNKDLAKVYGNT